MNMPVTLNAIATDVVGHYTAAAKSLVTAYRGASERALAASGRRYPMLGEGVARIADGYDRAIDLASAQALKGLEGFAERTDWAKDMLVVDAVRRINLPAAKLSLEIASRVDRAASALSARAQGTVEQPVAKPAVKKQPAKRVRRAA